MLEVGYFRFINRILKRKKVTMKLTKIINSNTNNNNSINSSSINSLSNLSSSNNNYNNKNIPYKEFTR